MPILISNGMSDEYEMDKAIEKIKNLYGVLHCNSSYPANKYELDLAYIPRLKESMDAFYNYMYAVIYQLSSHLEDYNYSFEFDEHFTNAIKKSLANIGVALNRISVNIEKYAHDNDIEHEMDEIFNGNTDIYDWADSFSELEKRVLLLLYYTGEKIQWSTLSIDATERRKDVICIAYDFAQGLKWLALDAAKSDTKDDLFMKHITNGGRMSKKYVELTLSELGIPYQES